MSSQMKFKIPLHPSNLSMAHKSIVLVSIPLALGSIFIMVLFVWLYDMHQQADREAHSRMVINQADAINETVVDAIYAMMGLIIMHNQSFADRYDRLNARAPEQFQILAKLVGKNQEQLKLVQQMQASIHKGSIVLDTLRYASDQGHDPQVVFRLEGLKSHLGSLLQEFFRAQENLLDSEESRLATSATIHQVDLSLKQIVACGVALNIVICMLIAAYFSKNVTNRLHGLIENTLRLANKEDLKPSLSGRDEIATLDSVFHQMAATMEQARERERAIVSNAADVICSLDADLNFVAVNPASLKVWDYSPSELIGHGLTEFTGGDDLLPIFTAVKRHGKEHATGFETQFHTKDNASKVMLWSAYWSESEKSFFCVSHDITDRKAGEELIKQNEARVRTIMDTAPVGLLIISEDGYIEAVNLQVQHMLGRSQDELLGKHLVSLFPKESERGQQPFMEKIHEKPSGHSLELYATRPSGESVPVELSIKELHLPQGERRLVTILDVSERHEIERLKQNFVAMISHDLKSPLTSIVCNLGLIAADAFGPLTEQGKEKLVDSEKQMEGLINLVNNLLLLERMEAGAFTITPAETDLADLLRRAITTVQKTAQERSIVIETDKTSAQVYVDDVRLAQVLVNLLDNAIKRSPPGGLVSLSIKEAADCFELQVKDRGPAISPAGQTEIFEKIKQLSSTDFSATENTDLGLVICKMIIDKHAGSIGVESAAGKDTSFWIRIPQTHK
jgi:PAS domain S-box-containing protein